ncbi:MAG: FecR domain-containing protein, partial [Candidatus Omnitrophica bacterium]|nr:FecR domain-containing protein [Candidatus Omnitrophota bacterium]
MNRKIIFLLFLNISVALCIYADNIVVGEVTFIEGVADVANDHKELLALREGSLIYLKDRLRTKNYSKLEITFLDKSKIRLAPDSVVTIENYEFFQNNKRKNAQILLNRGRIETIVSPTTKPDTFVVTTPNTKGAIKGSDIFISYLAGKTNVFVKDGAISIFNLALPQIKKDITKGSCVSIPFKEAPTEIRKYLDIELSIYQKNVQPSLAKKWIPQKGSAKLNAVIVFLSGEVQIYKKQEGDWRPAKVNDIFSEGDILQIGQDGKAEVRLANGNVIYIQPNTELEIITLRYDPKTGNYENTFQMTKGRIFGVVEKINEKSTFQVKTPIATCGVRGTFFDFSFFPEKTDTALEVFFEGGNGEVINNFGQIQHVGAGQSVIVDLNGNILPPIYTSEEKRLEILNNFNEIQTSSLYVNPPAENVPLPIKKEEFFEIIKSSGYPSEDIKKIIDEFRPQITYSEVNPPPPQIIYEALLTKAEGTHPNIINVSFLLTLMKGPNPNTGPWRGQIEGSFSYHVYGDWSIKLNNPNGDIIEFNNISGGMLYGTPGLWSYPDLDSF